MVKKIIVIIDRGAIDKAREVYRDNEALHSLIAQQYNRSGIGYRKESRFEDALAEYKKALMLAPEDEGLHYNISRVYIERGDWAAAKEAIMEALKINGSFKEGRDLLNYIRRQNPTG